MGIHSCTYPNQRLLGVKEIISFYLVFFILLAIYSQLSEFVRCDSFESLGSAFRGRFVHLTCFCLMRCRSAHRDCKMLVKKIVADKTSGLIYKCT